MADELQRLEDDLRAESAVNLELREQLLFVKQDKSELESTAPKKMANLRARIKTLKQKVEKDKSIAELIDKLEVVKREAEGEIEKLEEAVKKKQQQEGQADELAARKAESVALFRQYALRQILMSEQKEMDAMLKESKEGFNASQGKLTKTKRLYGELQAAEEEIKRQDTEIAQLTVEKMALEREKASLNSKLSQVKQEIAKKDKKIEGLTNTFNGAFSYAKSF